MMIVMILIIIINTSPPNDPPIMVGKASLQSSKGDINTIMMIMIPIHKPNFPP